MTKRSLKNHERGLRWEKKKVDKAVNEIIYKKAEKIVEVMADQALTGSFQHGAYLLDRAFGKARQNIGLDGGEDGSPVVFMPATLIHKFALDKPIIEHEPKE